MTAIQLSTSEPVFALPINSDDCAIPRTVHSSVVPENVEVNIMKCALFYQELCFNFVFAAAFIVVTASRPCFTDHILRNEKLGENHSTEVATGKWDYICCSKIIKPYHSFAYFIFFLIKQDEKFMCIFCINYMAGLSEICKGLMINYLTIVAINNTNVSNIDGFLRKMHESNIRTSIFTDKQRYLQFIEQNYMDSVETTSLIFSEPDIFLNEVCAHTICDNRLSIHKRLLPFCCLQLQSRRLGHRINLFMFFWNVNVIPRKHNWNLNEPLRVVIITRPRENVFRVFYNQADASGKGSLKIVNWYDGESLGLNATPLLKVASKVYKDFHGRIFHIPVFHVEFAKTHPSTHNTVLYTRSANILEN